MALQSQAQEQERGKEGKRGAATAPLGAHLAHEAGEYRVHACGCGPRDVFHVLIGHGGQLDAGAGQVDALALAQEGAVGGLAHHLAPRHGLDLRGDEGRGRWAARGSWPGRAGLPAP